MNIRSIILLTVLILGVFGADYFFFTQANVSAESAKAYHTEDGMNLIASKEQLSSIDQKTYYSIDVDRVVWYQNRYKEVKKLDCREYEDQPFERSYLLDRSTFEKNRLMNLNLDNETSVQ